MIILASSSPLKKMILEASGLQFAVIDPHIDKQLIERKHPQKTEQEIAVLLAVTKARAVAATHPDKLVIATNTFGTLPDGTRLHKTGPSHEAIQLAMQQSGKTVTVNTGLAMIYDSKTIVAHTATRITFSPFDEPTVRDLFSLSGKPRPAELGFFIGAPGFTLIERVDGSYLGALGLPMELVREYITYIGYCQDDNHRRDLL